MLKNSNSTILENHLNSFSSERTSLISKIENLAHETAKKDRDLLNLTHLKEQIEAMSARNEISLEKVRTELTTEKKNLAQKLEENTIQVKI